MKVKAYICDHCGKLALPNHHFKARASELDTINSFGELWFWLDRKTSICRTCWRRWREYEPEVKNADTD